MKCPCPRTHCCLPPKGLISCFCASRNSTGFVAWLYCSLRISLSALLVSPLCKPASKQRAPFFLSTSHSSVFRGAVKRGYMASLNASVIKVFTVCSAMFCALKRASVRQEAQSCTAPQRKQKTAPLSLPCREDVACSQKKKKNKLSATTAAPTAAVSEALPQPANASHFEPRCGSLSVHSAKKYEGVSLFLLAVKILCCCRLFLSATIRPFLLRRRRAPCHCRRCRLAQGCLHVLVASRGGRALPHTFVDLKALMLQILR